MYKDRLSKFKQNHLMEYFVADTSETTDHRFTNGLIYFFWTLDTNQRLILVIYTIFSVQILLRIIFYARLVVVALRILIHREKLD